MKAIYNFLLAVIVLLITQISFAQVQSVSGVVTDQSGVPIPGANVVVQSSKTGTQTDVDGKYSIKAKAGDVLVFSFVGMTETSAKVGTSNTVNVKMQDGVKLEEVLVTGALGIKRSKSAVTSSYSTVRGEELKVAGNPDPVRALIGKASGVTINATTNGVSGDNSIRIRSMVSLTGNTEALVVIDDVISTAAVFSSLAPDSVENVTILKGAQGAALYGSQGKSGVVVVTTKKGSKSKDRLDVRFSSGVDFESINFVPLRQTKYGQGWYNTFDQQENGGWGPLFDGVVRPVGITLPDGTDVLSPYSTKGDDVIKDFYKTGALYQNNISVGISGNDSYFNFNLNNYKRDFILPGDIFNRNNVLLNVGKKMGKWNLSGSVNYINSRTKQANVNSATSRGDYTLLTNLLQTASNIPIKEFENRGLYGWNGYYQNPYWAKDNNRLEEDRDFFNFALNPKYEFNKNISIHANNSVQVDTRSQISFANAAQTPGNADADFNSPASFYQSKFNRLYYYGDFILNLDYDLNKKVGLKANIGQNFQYLRNDRMSAGGLNFLVPGWYNIRNVINPDLPSTLNNSRSLNNITATYANVNLDYNDYLFLNLTARYEGNSVGISGNQFFLYPSAGLSFIPTKAFSRLKGNKTISNLKLFANYSKIGSLDAVSPYDVLQLGSLSGGFPFPNGTAVSFNDEFVLADPNLKPEMYSTYEAGLALSLFNDRIMFEGTYFNTDTKDLISESSVSSATGLTGILSNNGSLKSNGFELDLSFQPIKTDNFSWNGKITYSAFKTIVKDAGDGDSLIIFDGGSAGPDFNISAVEGQNFPSIVGTDWLRDASGNVIVNPTNGNLTIDPTFKVLGQATPDFIVGFTNSFNYKGIGLSFTADFRTGHSFISQTKYNLTWNGHLYDSGELDRANGWLTPNSVYDNPATPGVIDYIPNTSVLTGGFYNSTGAANLTQNYWNNAAQVGSQNLVDATSLRIREIALSYDLPKKFIEKAGLASFKFSINARNPFIFLADGKFIKAKNGTENRGYADPEAASIYNSSTGNGARRPSGTATNTSANAIGFIGDGQYPSTKTYGFNISVSF